MIRRPPRSTRTDTLFPYTTLFRSQPARAVEQEDLDRPAGFPDGGADGDQQHLLALVAAVGAVQQVAKTTPALGARPGLRSEEHTSELQSLMRISYAVFCLKKKNHKSKKKQEHKKNTTTD